jgi:transcriptional regulator with XRE-family HTH domain
MTGRGWAVKEFSGRLRQLREARGWTVYHLAKVSGVIAEGIRLLELRGADPRLSTVLKLAAALGVEVGELLKGIKVAGLLKGIKVAGPGKPPAAGSLDHGGARPPRGPG